MPHYVPHFEFNENALALRELSYEHWCEHGYGPNLRDGREVLGLGRRDIIRMWKRNRSSESMDPAAVIDYIKTLGVDVTNWGG